MRRTPFAHIAVLVAFLINSLGVLPASAQEIVLPKPGVMVLLSPPMNPPVLKGIKVHADNPFRFDFILDQGDALGQNDPERAKRGEGLQLKEESIKLIKYFLASLTIPEKDLWVNLSPYEKDRIIPESFGVTEMGRDLLAEDYMLKQITASLIYPEGETGKKFWKRIYEEAQSKYHTTNIPVNTFNKVWIVPEKAVVYENAKAGTAYVVESKLKVMLEADYLSLDKHNEGAIHESPVPNKNVNQLGSQIVREIVIPELTKEVNEGKNFAQLRQVYNSLILATWYKKKIKDSILSKVYADRSKTQGVNIDDPQEKERIYQQYLKAFKKGVYNYIKEESDPITNQTTPRKYFSGGFNLSFRASPAMTISSNAAMIPFKALTAALVLVTASLNMPTYAEDLDPHKDPLSSLGDYPSLEVPPSPYKAVTKPISIQELSSEKQIEENLKLLFQGKIQPARFLENIKDIRIYDSEIEFLKSLPPYRAEFWKDKTHLKKWMKLYSNTEFLKASKELDKTNRIYMLLTLDDLLNKFRLPAEDKNINALVSFILKVRERYSSMEFLSDKYEIVGIIAEQDPDSVIKSLDTSGLERKDKDGNIIKDHFYNGWDNLFIRLMDLGKKAGIKRIHIFQGTKQKENGLKYLAKEAGPNTIVYWGGHSKTESSDGSISLSLDKAYGDTRLVTSKEQGEAIAEFQERNKSLDGLRGIYDACNGQGCVQSLRDYLPGNQPITMAAVARQTTSMAEEMVAFLISAIPNGRALTFGDIYDHFLPSLFNGKGGFAANGVGPIFFPFSEEEKKYLEGEITKLGGRFSNDMSGITYGGDYAMVSEAPASAAMSITSDATQITRREALYKLGRGLFIATAIFRSFGNNIQAAEKEVGKEEKDYFKTEFVYPKTNSRVIVMGEKHIETIDAISSRKEYLALKTKIDNKTVKPEDIEHFKEYFKDLLFRYQDLIARSEIKIQEIKRLIADPKGPKIIAIEASDEVLQSLPLAFKAQVQFKQLLEQIGYDEKGIKDFMYKYSMIYDGPVLHLVLQRDPSIANVDLFPLDDKKLNEKAISYLQEFNDLQKDLSEPTPEQQRLLQSLITDLNGIDHPVSQERVREVLAVFTPADQIIINKMILSIERGKKVTRDERNLSMRESLKDALKQRPGEPILVFVGTSHGIYLADSMKKLSSPAMLKEAPSSQAMSVNEKRAELLEGYLEDNFITNKKVYAVLRATIEYLKRPQNRDITNGDIRANIDGIAVRIFGYYRNRDAFFREKEKERDAIIRRLNLALGSRGKYGLEYPLVENTFNSIIKEKPVRSEPNSFSRFDAVLLMQNLGRNLKNLPPISVDPNGQMTLGLDLPEENRIVALGDENQAMKTAQVPVDLERRVSSDVVLAEDLSPKEFDRRWQRYVLENGLTGYQHLLELFNRNKKVKEALLDDPSLKPVFLQVLKGKNSGNIKKVDAADQRIGTKTLLDYMQEYSSFLVGDSRLANQMIQNRSAEIVIGITDRYSEDALHSLHQVANGRQAFFPLPDGKWLGVKGVGQFIDSTKPPFYLREQRRMRFEGIAFEFEAQRALAANNAFLENTYEFARFLGYRRINAIPDGEGNLKDIKEGYPQFVLRDNRPVLIFSLFLSPPERLVKLPQIVKVDPGLKRISQKIARSMIKAGKLPDGTVWTGKDLMMNIFKTRGRAEALKQNKGLYKITIHPQDMTIAGEETDNEEFVRYDQYLDLRNNGVAMQNEDKELLEEDKLSVAGIKVMFNTLTAFMRALPKDQLEILLPRPLENLEAMFKAYFSSLDSSYLRFWTIPYKGISSPLRTWERQIVEFNKQNNNATDNIGQLILKWAQQIQIERNSIQAAPTDRAMRAQFQEHLGTRKVMESIRIALESLLKEGFQLFSDQVTLKNFENIGEDPAKIFRDLKEDGYLISNHIVFPFAGIKLDFAKHGYTDEQTRKIENVLFEHQGDLGEMLGILAVESKQIRKGLMLQAEGYVRIQARDNSNNVSLDLHFLGINEKKEKRKNFCENVLSKLLLLFPQKEMEMRFDLSDPQDLKILLEILKNKVEPSLEKSKEIDDLITQMNRYDNFDLLMDDHLDALLERAQRLIIDLLNKESSKGLLNNDDLNLLPIGRLLQQNGFKQLSIIDQEGNIYLTTVRPAISGLKAKNGISQAPASASMMGLDQVKSILQQELASDIDLEPVMNDELGQPFNKDNQSRFNIVFNKSTNNEYIVQVLLTKSKGIERFTIVRRNKDAKLPLDLNKAFRDVLLALNKVYQAMNQGKNVPSFETFIVSQSFLSNFFEAFGLHFDPTVNVVKRLNLLSFQEQSFFNIHLDDAFWERLALDKQRDPAMAVKKAKKTTSWTDQYINKKSILTLISIVVITAVKLLSPKSSQDKYTIIADDHLPPGIAQEVMKYTQKVAFEIDDPKSREQYKEFIEAVLDEGNERVAAEVRYYDDLRARISKGEEIPAIGTEATPEELSVMKSEASRNVALFRQVFPRIWEDNYVEIEKKMGMYLNGPNLALLVNGIIPFEKLAAIDDERTKAEALQIFSQMTDLKDKLPQEKSAQEALEGLLQGERVLSDSQIQQIVNSFSNPQAVSHKVEFIAELQKKLVAKFSQRAHVMADNVRKLPQGSVVLVGKEDKAVIDSDLRAEGNKSNSPAMKISQTPEGLSSVEEGDRAMKDTGGIDLTSKEFLETQNAGEGIKFHMDSAMLQQLQNASGFYPVIINIQPMIDLKGFLGISEAVPAQTTA